MYQAKAGLLPYSARSSQFCRSAWRSQRAIPERAERGPCRTSTEAENEFRHLPEKAEEEGIGLGRPVRVPPFGTGEAVVGSGDDEVVKGSPDLTRGRRSGTAASGPDR